MTETLETQDEPIEIIDTPEPDEPIDIETGEPEGEQPQEQPEKKTDRVEFSTPEQQAKFNDIYKQMKMSDNRNKMLTDLLEKQQEQLDKVMSRFSQSDESEAENTILSRIQQARDEGDTQAEMKAQNELFSLKTQKIIDQKVNDILRTEQQATEKEAKYVASLMQETDPNGGLVRPWLHENHPQFNDAISKLSVIAYKYMNDPNVLQKSLSELDQVMKKPMTENKPPEPPKAQTRAAHPMQGSNLTNQKPKGRITMTRQEIEIAKKLGVDPKKYAARRDAEKGGR